jgi:hypothetical protein
VTEAPATSAPRTQIYTFGDAGYFLGIVALVNSLRLTGNDDPIVVLDIGLEPRQRRLLERECRFMDATPLQGTSPWQLFPFPVFDEPHGVIAIVDADVIVTADLEPYFEQAAGGGVVAFPDPHSDRWFAEWEGEFGLAAPVRTGQPYANAGLVVFSTVEHPTLLGQWWRCCERLGGRPTALDDGDVDSPVAYGDQDALNALLASVVAPADVAIQPAGSALFVEDEFARMRVLDVSRLVCEHDGRRVVMLHRIFEDKPWQPSSWRTIRRTPYLRCLRRALSGPGLAIRVDDSDLPPWLRRGPRGTANAWAYHGVELAVRTRRWCRRRSLRRRPAVTG